MQVVQGEKSGAHQSHVDSSSGVNEWPHKVFVYSIYFKKWWIDRHCHPDSHAFYMYAIQNVQFHTELLVTDDGGSVQSALTSVGLQLHRH